MERGYSGFSEFPLIKLNFFYGFISDYFASQKHEFLGVTLTLTGVENSVRG